MNFFTKAITFPGHQGLPLSGRLDMPADTPVKRTAIFAHCFTCSKTSLAARHVAGSLAQRGFCVLRFDFAGLGDSSGEFSSTNYSTNVADLVSAAAYLAEHYEAPSLLVGHSFGGAAVITASASIPSIQAIATIAAPSDPQHVEHLFSDNIDAIRAKGEAEVRLAGRPFRINKQFLDDIAAVKLEKILPKMKKALLILHAPEDSLVGIEHAQAIYKLARHPKSFISLAGADHLLTKSRDAEYVAEVISSWSQRYLDMNDDNPVQETTERPPKDVVRVTEMSSTKGMMQKIATASHDWVGDEPEGSGGGNKGPTPFQLLLAGLGTCTTMTARLYARRKGWDPGPFEVDVTYDRQASDGRTGRGVNRGMYHKIVRRLRNGGELTADQRRDILAIVEKCPVNNALGAAPVVITEWDGAEESTN